MRKLNRVFVLILAGALSISGCGGDSRSELLPPSAAKHQPKGEGEPHGAGQTPWYSPGKGLNGIPLPSDVLFANTPDGTLNIPGVANSNSKYSPDEKALDDPLVALNTMDGFGVTTDLLVPDLTEGDAAPPPASLLPTEHIHIYETTVRNPWPVAGSSEPALQVNRELLYGADYIYGSAPEGYSRIVLVKPLKPYTTYLVTVAEAPDDADNTLRQDPRYELLQSTEPFVFRKGTGELCDYTDAPESLADCTDLNPAYKGELSLKQALALEGHRQVTNAQIRAIVEWEPPETGPFPDAYPFNPEALPPAPIDYTRYEEAADSIFLSYSVTTQKAGYALAQAFNVADDLPVPQIDVSPSGITTQAARLYSGTLNGAVQFLDPADPNRDIWEAPMNRNLVYENGMVPMIKAADHDIPVLVSVPTGDDCTGPLAVTIFQHDILRNRGDLRYVADALARACTVGVAIDLPKHGIAPGEPENGVVSRGDEERLVPVLKKHHDCVTEEPFDIGTPGKRCPSGDGFINGDNLANTRDTVRQAVVDMYSLYRAVIGGGLAAEELDLAAIDPDQVHFLGHGYGASLGLPFIANAIPEDGSRRFATITFNAGPGGGLFRMLDGSFVLDDLLLETIDAPRGSPEWDLKLLIGQTLLDSLNDFNAVRDLGLAGPVSGFDQAPILAQEIVGYDDAERCASTGRCPDQVIPNNLYAHWLSEWHYTLDFLGGTSPIPEDNGMALLAGTDPITQGTVFVPAHTFLINRQEAREVGPLGTIEGIDSYSGLGLTEITQLRCGHLASDTTTDDEPQIAPVEGLDMVRFIRGSHNSLLGTDDWPAVTDYMRDQITEWIASGGTRLVCDPARNSVNAMLRRD